MEIEKNYQTLALANKDPTYPAFPGWEIRSMKSRAPGGWSYEVRQSRKEGSSGGSSSSRPPKEPKQPKTPGSKGHGGSGSSGGDGNARRTPISNGPRDAIEAAANNFVSKEARRVAQNKSKAELEVKKQALEEKKLDLDVRKQALEEQKQEAFLKQQEVMLQLMMKMAGK